MIIREFVNNLIRKYKIQDDEFPLMLSQFMVDTHWLGEPPVEGELADDFEKKHRLQLGEFAMNYRLSPGEKATVLMSKAMKEIPVTIERFEEYADNEKLDDAIRYQIVDFMRYELPGELHLSDDAEIGNLLEKAFDTLKRVYGDALTDFINWYGKNYQTAYKRVYVLSSRTTQNTDAYAPDEYMRLMYYLYNEEYIAENDMYASAARSKNYTDCWLYLAIHFVCALRNTDLIRFPHPRLPYEPEEVLDLIENGKFPAESAKAVLRSILTHQAYMPHPPHKTEDHSGIADIKFHVPTSTEEHIGILFALAEAHYRLCGSRDDALIRPITSYEQITRYMGEEIGDLFLESDFRTRSANKSYMQLVYLLTDDVTGHEDEFHVKGYMMAAIARSHKGSYGQFAETTIRYLKDAKMSGYSAEFVAKELLERGVLSFAASTLLKMIIGEDYNHMTVETQTSAIKVLNMSGLDIERSVGLAQAADKRSIELAKELYSSTSKEEVVKILHRIGNGTAVSKIDESMCLITAIGKLCPYSDRSNCIGCEYEIATRSTLFLLVSEYSRLLDLYKSATNEHEKGKYKALAGEAVLPAVDTMLQFIRQECGEEEFREVESIIREMTNGK